MEEIAQLDSRSLGAAQTGVEQDPKQGSIANGPFRIATEVSTLKYGAKVSVGENLEWALRQAGNTHLDLVGDQAFGDSKSDHSLELTDLGVHPANRSSA